MRALALLAIVYGATISVVSALVDIGGMVSSCIADGCDYTGDIICYAPTCCCENTLDGSTSSLYRWSCKGDECCITYYFEEPQNIVIMRISFYKGDERTRTLEVYDNGAYHSKITSSGTTAGYQSFYLNTHETDDLKLCHDDNGDDWLSITEVKLMVN